MFRRIVDKISNFFRGSLHIIGTLTGVKWKGEWSAEGTFIAGWIFIVGIPVGMLLISPSFPITGWLLIVLTVLMITNLDDALVMMSNYLTYGVNGDKVAPYERNTEEEELQDSVS